jgi:hypothetical protein
LKDTTVDALGKLPEAPEVVENATATSMRETDNDYSRRILHRPPSRVSGSAFGK